jgi:hypothetical protein
MSNTRIFWIIWCCFWALGWLLIGFFLIVTWLFVPVSLLAILIPIGRTRAAPKQVTFGAQPQATSQWQQQPRAHSQQQPTAPPGWYPDESGTARWWDGATWHQPASRPTSQPPQTRWAPPTGQWWELPPGDRGSPPQ